MDCEYFGYLSKILNVRILANLFLCKHFRRSHMAEITIIGSKGKPILYASLEGESLRFQFEYYATKEDPMDYEFIHTVAPEDFASIAKRFGLDPKSDILSIIQQITDGGRGQEFKKALTDKKIKNHLWTWLSPA